MTVAVDGGAVARVMFAVVEIMGHRTRAGAISDATIGGATLLRIEHPILADESGEEPLTEYYAPQAIFSIRPCSADEAEQVAKWAWAANRQAALASPELAELVEAVTVDDEDRYDTEDPF